MADKTRAYASHELATLKLRLQERDQTLAKHRLVEDDLREHCARLEAEVAQLKTELARSHQVLAESLPLKEKCTRREKQAIAKQTFPPTNVDDSPTQLTEAAHANRLLSLGMLAADLTHELNQPLSAIASYAYAGLHLPRGGTFDEQEVTRLFDRIAGQADYAGELMRRIRRFAARGEPERAPLNINDAVREALTLMETQLHKQQVHTCLHLQENVPTIMGDRVQIIQVLLNLISNAIEAMHDAPERLLTLTTQATETEVQVSVSDTGAGLSIEVIHNLFQAFRSSKPHGMGLGLAICRKIVQAHCGRLWVKPNPQRGTTFYIALLLSRP